MSTDTVTIDRATGEIVEAAQTEGCRRCEAEASRAETLEGDLRGAEAELRRQRRTIEALKAELRQQREEDPQAKEIREVLDYWRERCGHPTAKVPLDGERAKKVRTALRQKHTVAELKEAIDGCAMRPYVSQEGRKAEGAKRERHDDLELICRNEKTIDRFRQLAQEAQQPAATAKPKAVQRQREVVDVGDVLHRLEAVRQEKTGQWQARCPAHEDRHASLSVAQGDKGCVLHCHAGCQFEDIVAALQLTPDALFAPEDPTPIRRPKPKVVTPPKDVAPLPSEADLDVFHKRAIVNQRLLDRLFQLRGWTVKGLVALQVGFDGRRLVLPIRDGTGRLVNVVRYTPSPRDGEPKIKAAKGHGRDLFPAPETLDGGELWVLEGEPDSITAAELGLPGVALPGVNGWRDTYAPRFAGRKVVVLMDCDNEGRAAAQRVAPVLAGHAAEVRVVDLDGSRSDHYDLTDAVRDGATADVLRALAAEAPALDWREREEAAA